jgi:hypothetical protein
MAATDLVAWTKLIGFTEHSERACCEIATFRYRVLHVAARIPARPTSPAAHRCHLVLGTGHRHRLAPHPHRLHLTPSTPDRARRHE